MTLDCDRAAAGVRRPAAWQAAAAPGGHRSAERRDAVAATGQPAYRADQLSRHYFGARSATSPRCPTSPPRPARLSGAALLPRCSPTSGRCECDDGRTRKTLWRLARRRPGRERRHAVPRPSDDVHLLAGRLRHGLPVLRDRPGRADPQPLDRRDRGADRPSAVAARSTTSCSWGWVSRSRTTTRLVRALRRITDPPPAGLGIGRRHLTVSTVGLVPGDRPARRRRAAGDARGVVARPGRRAAQHPGAGQHPLAGRRGARRCLALRRRHRAPGLDRVRADPRHQRPARARPPARSAAGRAARLT